MAHKCDGCRYKGTHQEMMFRPFGVCTRETNIMDAEKNFNAEKCPYKKTNADRIRAMSDEEMMDLLFTKISCGHICSFCVPTMRTERKCDGHCRNGVLEWLQQPVKED